MKRRVLSVLPTPVGLRDEVEEVLEKELTDILFEFKGAGNEDKAREKLRGEEYDLVVSSLDIPKDSKALPEDGLRRGLGLAQWMEKENMKIPTILLTEAGDTDLEKVVNKLANCELVILKLGWDDLFIKRVRRGLEGKTVTEQKRLDVDIFFYLDKKMAMYEFRGVGPLRPTPLNIPFEEFLKLVEDCADLEKKFKGPWESSLQCIGVKLMTYIFENDSTFSRLFWIRVKEAGGLNNTRIRFVVEKEVHPIALEAIYGPDVQSEEGNYWMLHTPIYRTVGKYAAWGEPLFHDQETREGPLDILIIKSPTEGRGEFEGWTVPQEPEKPLEKLENVEVECNFIENYRDSPEYSGRVKIGKVKLIPIPGDPRHFADQVQETLEHNKWHIVHYSGHSYYSSDTKKGYVFFPGGQDEKGEPVLKVVDLEKFSGWLLNAKPNLVFLSSCHSSEAEFVFEMAKNCVPAIVGFRWDVQDDMAAEYTKVFYGILFGGKMQSLEDVFLKARQEIHERYKDKPIWAAPVLVMQNPAR
ncbi:MAG: CHAT domain-containing protein [Smithella sp.]